MNNMLENITRSNKDKRKILFFVLLAIVGVAVILIANKSAGEQTTDKSELADLDPAQYARYVEERVEELCNKIDGVSSTYAVVTLKGGYTAIYASDVQNGTSNSKNQTVIIGSGSQEKGLLIGYQNPEISGIGIVCSGGDDYNIRKNIISVVSSAFDLSSNKIFVAGS